MAKKRKTRQEKIILQLKRKLASGTKIETRQEANFKAAQVEAKPKPISKNMDVSTLSYNPAFVKKDILKTLILTLIVISLEAVLYLKLR